MRALLTKNFMTPRRVRRGVERLDAEMPGWAQFIDPSRLDLGDGYRCVLGQLYRGAYNQGEAVLFGRDRSAFRAELQAVRHGLYEGLFSSNESLTDEWKQLITIRQFDAERLEDVCVAQAKAREAAALEH